MNDVTVAGEQCRADAPVVDAAADPPAGSASSRGPLKVGAEPAISPVNPRIDTLLAGVTWLLVLSVLQRGIGFGRNVLVCRYLDPVELGKWNILFQFLVTAPPLLVLGIPGTFGRYVEAYRLRGELGGFLRRTLAVTTGCTLLGAVVLVLARDWVAETLFHDPTQTRIAVLATLLAVILVGHNLLNQLLAALRLPRALSIVNFVNTIVFSAVCLILLLGTTWGAIGVAASYGAGCLVASVVAWWVVRRWWNESVPAAGKANGLWMKLAPLALWIWTSDLCFNLFAVVDRYMLVHLGGTGSDESLRLVGQFHASHVLGVLLISLGDLLSSVSLPYLTHDWETGNRAAATRRLNRSTQLVSLMLTACAAAMVLIAPWVFDGVMQGKYAQGREVLPMMLAFCIWYALTLQMKNYLWLCERGYWITVALMLGIALNVMLNWWWLPHYGLSGAVAATAVANFFVLAAIASSSWRFGWRGDWRTWVAMVLPASLVVHPAAALAAALAMFGWALSAGAVHLPPWRGAIRLFGWVVPVPRLTARMSLKSESVS
jgi:O-antigen/teichoic acid export membrane protein